MYLVEISPEDVGGIKFTVDLLGKLDVDDSEFQLWLYGLSKNRIHCRAAEVCLEGDLEDGATPIRLQEVAFALPLTSETTKQLLGAGLTLSKDTEFSYLAGQEGARSSYLFGLERKYRMPTAKLDDFTKLAVSHKSDGIDDFMDRVGSKPLTTQAESVPGINSPRGEVIPPAAKSTVKPKVPTPNSIDQFLNS